MSRFATTRDDKSSLQDLLQVMVSPDEYRKKFAEMCEFEVKLDEKIAQAAIADEILMVREHAHHDRSVAKKELEETQAHCSDLEAKAQAKAQGIIEAANQTRLRLISEGEARLKEAKENADALINNAQASLDQTRAGLERQVLDLAQERGAVSEELKQLAQDRAHCDHLKAQLESQIAAQEEKKRIASEAAAHYTNLHKQAIAQLEAARANLIVLYADKL